MYHRGRARCLEGIGDRVDQLRDLIGEQLHELRTENEGLEAQLDSATVTIDRLRDRRKFYSKQPTR